MFETPIQKMMLYIYIYIYIYVYMYLLIYLRGRPPIWRSYSKPVADSCEGWYSVYLFIYLLVSIVASGIVRILITNSPG